MEPTLEDGDYAYLNSNIEIHKFNELLEDVKNIKLI